MAPVCSAFPRRRAHSDCLHRHVQQSDENHATALGFCADNIAYHRFRDVDTKAVESDYQQCVNGPFCPMFSAARCTVCLRCC